MNDRLLSYDGGQPAYANDLTFIQDTLFSIHQQVCKGFGDNYIVWGCLDEEKTNVVEGAVVIGGKLYQVPSLGPVGPNKLCYREVLSDERVFEDGQTHRVKKSLEAYLSTDTSGAVAYVDLITLKRPYQSALFSESQTLTEAQKLQVIKNVGLYKYISRYIKVQNDSHKNDISLSYTLEEIIPIGASNIMVDVGSTVSSMAIPGVLARIPLCGRSNSIYYSGELYTSAGFFKLWAERKQNGYDLRVDWKKTDQVVGIVPFVGVIGIAYSEFLDLNE